MDEKCSQDMIGLYARNAMDQIIRTFNTKGTYLREDTLMEIRSAVTEYQYRKDIAEREGRKGGIDNG